MWGVCSFTVPSVVVARGSDGGEAIERSRRCRCRCAPVLALAVVAVAGRCGASPLPSPHPFYGGGAGEGPARPRFFLSFRSFLSFFSADCLEGCNPDIRWALTSVAVVVVVVVALRPPGGASEAEPGRPMLLLSLRPCITPRTFPSPFKGGKGRRGVGPLSLFLWLLSFSLFRRSFGGVFPQKSRDSGILSLTQGGSTWYYLS